MGGSYDSIPALFGAMALCRKDDTGLPFNCHFLGRYFYGNMMIVGRGKGDEICELPEHLQKIIGLALKEGKR